MKYRFIVEVEIANVRKASVKQDLKDLIKAGIEMSDYFTGAYAEETDPYCIDRVVMKKATLIG